MARGWESKDVESQQDLREDERKARQQPRQTPEQKERDHRLADLQLNRTRVQADLDMAKNPRYKEMLETSLRFLDAEVERLKAAPLLRQDDHG